jgi:two-component system OmpR family response regulator
MALVFWRLRRGVSAVSGLRLAGVASGAAHLRAPDSSESLTGGSAADAPLVRHGARASSTVSEATHTRTPIADLAARLEPASRLIGANGMAVWGLCGDGSALDVLAGYGYSEALLARLGPMPLDAPALTAVACAERRVRKRRRHGTRLAAIAVPMERDGLAVGVLTAEIDPATGDHVTPEAEALVRLLASQMTSIVAALVPATAHFKPASPRPVTALLPAYPIATPPEPDVTPSPPVEVHPAESVAVPALVEEATAIEQFPSERAARNTPRRLPAFEPIQVRVRVDPPPVPAATIAPARPSATLVDEDYEASVREARSRFIAGFRKRCAAIDELFDEVAVRGPDGPLVALRQIVHRLSGLAVIVGLPTVGARATELDRLLESPHAAAADLDRVRRVFQAMQDGFTTDLSAESPTWAAASGAAVGAHVMLVTTDAAQAARMVEDLQAADYRVTLIGQGLRAVAQAGVDRPDLVLLDVELSGDLDGHDVCRRIKADPALAEIPVVLVASHASTADRMAGFALGADDYLTKPVQTVEMLLRVRWTLTRPAGDRAPAPRAGGGLMAADPFVAAAREVLRLGPAALGLVRAAPGAMADLAAIFSDDLRRKDLLGRYSETQLAVLMPGATAGVAARRIGGVLDIAQAAGLEMVCAGVTATGLSADRFVEPMLAEAESALSTAQVEGTRIVVYGAGATAERGSVLIVDDDPDVVHVIDARLKAAGLQTLVAFDGQQALHQVETAAPAVVVLELMLPKRSGFDVLARLREMPEPRPRVVILSSRSREEDVMRAFELGADDYLTKPFNPQELLARLARLLK